MILLCPIRSAFVTTLRIFFLSDEQGKYTCDIPLLSFLCSRFGPIVPFLLVRLAVC